MDQVYLVPGGIKCAHVKQDEAAMADKAIEILKRQMETGEEVAEDIRIPGIFRKPYQVITNYNRGKGFAGRNVTGEAFSY